MKEKHFYDFDGFRIDSDERILLREGEIVPLTQKAFDVLLILVERHGRIVTKEELMNEVWPDTFVEEGNLAQNIYTLRKILGESPRGDDYIKTIPRRGYRFAATVRESRSEEIEIPTAELLRLVDLKKKKFGNEFLLGSNIVTPGLAPTEPDLEEGRAEEDRGAVQEAAIEHQVASDMSEDFIRRIKRHKKSLALSTSILLLLLFGVVGWFIFRETIPSRAFSNIAIRNLTTAGNIQCVALSPDGKIVVYGMTDKPHLSSLRVMQLSTSTTQTIIQPQEAQYHAVTVSPDGSYVYFVRMRNDSIGRVLYRVPLLGGVVTKLLDNVHTGVAFSPDGKQIAFRRAMDDRRESAMFIANADGTGEHEIAAVKYPDLFSDPAWSPDGKTIACAAGHAEGGRNKYVTAIRIDYRGIRTITPERWQWIGQVAWLRDSNGLVMVGNKEASEPIQIWQLDYPSGKSRKITNDGNFYNRLSLSAGAGVIAAMQQKLVTNLWTMPAGESGKAQQVSFGAGGYRGKLSWTLDDRIVFDSESGSATAISIMNADGANQRRLTDDSIGRAIIGYATTTPDGRFILYFSDLTGTRNIWRMNIDGSNPIQLTQGGGEDHPTCSPDGKWVVFTQKENTGEGKPTLWKVSIDGGNPVQIVNAFTGYPSISPDGKLIACFYSPTLNTPWQPAIFSFEDGRLIKVFPQSIKNSPYIRWTPDGKGLIYAENDIGPSILWMQPIDGAEAKSLVQIETDRIFGFDWSRDGKRLAYVRGFWSQNIVVISDIN